MELAEKQNVYALGIQVALSNYTPIPAKEEKYIIRDEYLHNNFDGPLLKDYLQQEWGLTVVIRSIVQSRNIYDVEKIIFCFCG